MASLYPSGLDSLNTGHQDSVGEIIHASDVNNIADAVNKIEAELGTLPKGQFASVSAKLGQFFYGSIADPTTLTAGNRPKGLIVFNTTNNRYEYNSGSDASPTWSPVGPTGPWTTSNLSNGAVTTPILADGAVTTIKIADANVTAAKLAGSIPASALLNYPNDVTKVLRGDGTWTIPLAYGGSVSSASSIAVTPNSTMLITGTTNVQTFTGGTSGAALTLVASGQTGGTMVVFVTNTGNLRLRDGNTGIYAGESISFVYDGTNWIEVDRNTKSEITYSETTNTTNIAGTSAGAPTTIVTSSSFTADGNTAVVVDFCTLIQASSGFAVGDLAACDIWLDSTDLGVATQIVAQENTTNFTTGAMGRRRFIPAAGAHTVSLRVWHIGSGTWNVIAGAGGTGAALPTFIRVARSY